MRLLAAGDPRVAVRLHTWSAAQAARAELRQSEGS